MKKTGFVVTFILLLGVLLDPWSGALAATDGFYQLSEVTAAWDGTDANRTKARNPDYHYTYGDETSLTYTLPWSFSFYGQSYNQINVDTNGNVWFGTSGFARSFNLASNGRGPVITAWNFDLSSYYYGGVFVQHKSNPDRVVIEWQAETYADEGYSRPNNFEVVLFLDGSIRADYKSFNAVNRRDFGSGISKNDGTHYLDLTANYGAVYTLSGRSFAITGTPLSDRTLSVIFTGTGSGSVTSTPAGIACNTNCSSIFPPGTLLTLIPAASEYNLFGGWSNGQCVGLGDCQFTLNSDTAVTATFTKDSTHQVSIGGPTQEYYSTIQSAYNTAASESVIRLWAIIYNESLICHRPVTVTFQGGYDSGYTNITGEAVLNGTLTITDGAVIADGLTIK